MSSYIIGDLQGCYDKLKQLLTTINFCARTDYLYFTGDLVNRGGQSLEVLRFIYENRASMNSVLGNHDLHFLAEYEKKPEQRKNNQELERVYGAEDAPQLVNWLRHRPLMIELDQYLITHAGIDPAWDLPQSRQCARYLESLLKGHHYQNTLVNMYGNTPNRWQRQLKNDDRLRTIVNSFTRMRYCYPDGGLHFDYKGRIDERPSGLIPWFHQSTRISIDKTIVFGHWSALGFYQNSDVICLDTGAVWGHELLAMKLAQPLDFIYAN